MILKFEVLLVPTEESCVNPVQLHIIIIKIMRSIPPSAFVEHCRTRIK